MHQKIVTLFHDIELDYTSNAEKEKCIAAINSLLEIEKKYKISATYNIIGKVFLEHPDLIDEITSQGHDVAFHSFTHGKNLKRNLYREEISLCRKISFIPKGYRSPESRWNSETLTSLWENGFLWNAEDDQAGEPYFIHKGLVRIPISMDDWGVHIKKQKINEWHEQFSRLLSSRVYVAIGTHDFVMSSSLEESIHSIEKNICIALDKNARFLTFSQTADLYRRVSMSRYYSHTARQWNATALTYNTTKRFQEIILGEVKKKRQPIIADLGSAGGILSNVAASLASRIYCIDNSSGMIASVQKNKKIVAVYGEATDTSLPNDSVDIVICSRLIEYLFDPADLAREIKRIGKIGAVCIATFPAQLKRSLHDGSPPNRIRKSFSKDEVSLWSKMVGLGEIIGIGDLDSSHPKYYKKKHAGAIVTSQSDTVLKNWIFIGRIVSKADASHRVPIIPLSVGEGFRCTNQRQDVLISYIKNMGRNFPGPIKNSIKAVLYRY